MIKQLTASGGGTLEANSGESLRLKGIEVVPSSNDTYLTISIDRVTVAYYRIKGKAGNHLGTLRNAYLKANVMEYLANLGVNVTIPIAEGQKLTVERYAEAGNVILVYDRFSPGDVKASDPNGTESNVYTMLQYAKVGTAPTASGDALIDTSLSPAQFPDFPCNKVVPARHVIEMLGVVGSPFNDAAAGPEGFATSFMKFIRDREVLFDDDRLGIPFDAQNAAATALSYGANFSLIGPNTEVLLNTNAIGNGPPLMFDPPLKFEAGAELNVYLSVVKTSTATWTDNVDDQAFIMRIRRQ